MQHKTIIAASLAIICCLFYNCTSSSGSETTGSDSTKVSSVTAQYGGYASQKAWGEHLVVIGGCNDCHTPKKMTAQGPADDPDRRLSGSPVPALLPAVTHEQVAKGMAATVDETAWIGPWGKSFAANITSDATGIGSWTEAQFINCLRKGVYQGLDGARPLMPPMPVKGISQMTDDELKAIFAYLKSTTPVHNVVPQYEPPVMAKNSSNP